MDRNKIEFQEPAMQPIFERFKTLFAPHSEISDDIAQDVKVVVWIRMVYAFHPLVQPREIRLHYLKSFHPDTGTEQLTMAEKNNVTSMAGFIFKGVKAANDKG